MMLLDSVWLVDLSAAVSALVLINEGSEAKSNPRLLPLYSLACYSYDYH